MNTKISKRTLNRLPVYLSLLREKQREGIKTISATAIANMLNLNHVQVRKDLACASNAGKPKVGYGVEVLIRDLVDFLDYNSVKDAVVIGAGDLGKALMGYTGFASYGLNINAAFDINEDICGTTVKGKPIYHLSKLAEVCSNKNIHIGIITTPASVAQQAADMLVEAGVLGIWNFAPTSLKVPETVIVQNENMATSLAILSNRINEMNK